METEERQGEAVNRGCTEERRREGRGRRIKDLDDDKCFLRRNVIYAVIRIVATNLPCGWCIMIATTYIRVNALHGYSTS